MKPSGPADLPVRETLGFMRSVLPPGARVLEVGCGEGALAEQLQTLGWDVTALDRDPKKVARTRARGVETVEQEFLAFQGGGFDAVLFTRSLHHLDPLTDAIDHARSRLHPGGLLVAEEFAIEAMNLDTARWFFELRSLLEATGMMPAPEPALTAPNPLERWFEAHAPVQPLHPGEDMLLAIGGRLELVAQHRVPYLYRTFCDRIEPSDRGLRVGEWLLEAEARRIAEHSVVALGLRMIARR